jgi:periplasmic protein TonB
MSYLVNNEQKMIEIIFANRNKNYGAYVIRSAYGNTIFKSLSIMLAGFGSLLSIAFYFSQKEPEQKNPPMIFHDSIYVIKFQQKEIEELVEEVVEKKTEKSVSTTDSKNSTNIVDSAVAVQINTLPAETTVAKDPVIGTEGSATGSPSAVITPTATGSTAGTGIKRGFEVDRQPEFEGGLKALYQFVAKHLKYPERASYENKGGTVYVKFVVDEEGYVGSLSALNNLGYGLDEEALRVVGMIPKFKSPAMAGGEPVKVYFQLPICFKVK